MKRTFIILRDGIRLFLDNHSFDRSAAISFYAFLSVIPILLLIVASLGYVFGAREDILEDVVGMAQRSFPYLSERMIVKDLKDLSQSWTTLGWFGLGMLFLSAELVLNALAEALIHIFGVEERYGFIRKRIINVLVVFLAVFSALVSILASVASGILRGVRVLGFDVHYYLFENFILKYIFPFAVVVLGITLVYRVFSGSNMNFRYAFYGSLLFGVLWEVAKHLFGLYIIMYPSYNRFYGSLGTLTALLVWLYSSAAIFLFSAAIARAAFRAKQGLRA